MEVEGGGGWEIIGSSKATKQLRNKLKYIEKDN